MFAKFTKIVVSFMTAILLLSSISAVSSASARGPVQERAVDTSEGFTCAIRQTDIAYCVGKNDKGQLGFQTLSVFSDPTPVPGLAGALSITTGKSFACAIGLDEYGYCWGDDELGQLGTNSPGNQAKRIDLAKTIIDIQAGRDYSCALSIDLTIYCWGSLGNYGPESNNTSVPSLVSGVSGVTAIGVGDEDVCYISTSLYCWGKIANSKSPVKIPDTSGVTSLAVGANFVCYIKSQLVYCFGDNSNGQLGRGNTSSSTSVDVVKDLGSAAAIFAGGQSACAVTTNGASFCWGDNDNKQVAITSGDQPNRVPSSFATAVSFGISNTHVCALLKDSNLSCVGDNASYQSGYLTATEKPLPSATNGPMWSVSAGATQTCAITRDYKLKCWGDFLPVVDPDKQFREVAVGSTSACAIAFDGKVLCWGSNSSGQLGDNSNRNSSKPVEVQGITYDAVEIKAGLRHFCAISEDGLVYCWGDNLKDQLGMTGEDSKVAKLVPGVATARDLALGDYHSCVLLMSWRVYCWGDNSKKQISSSSSAKLPVTELGIANSVEIAAGGNNTCYIFADDNKLTCIGDNTDLQAPGTLTGTYTKVSVGGNSVCANRYPDLKIVCFGSNAMMKLGRLGLKSATPSEVADLRQGQVSVGAQHSCFVASVDGTMYCWGSNSDGQLASSFGFPSAFKRPTLSVSGKLNIGEKISAVAVTPNVNQITYQWYRYLGPNYTTAVKIPDATKSSFDLAASEITRTIAIGVRLQKWGATSEEFLSSQTVQVGSQLRLLLTPQPLLSGKYKVGSRLSVRAGRWESGVTLTYQWFRGAAPIAGAKAPTYLLSAKDVGKQISVTVTGSKVGLPKASMKSPKSIKIVR